MKAAPERSTGKANSRNRSYNNSVGQSPKKKVPVKKNYKITGICGINLLTYQQNPLILPPLSKN
ncbi:MAG: hypothetical protein BGN92_11210 [Sphingobacteriales bacterium 41-5]|nr:MAG: hypothetical protein BGN92_11210 [Sphingobacteriales bacterium 41-5]